MKTLFRTLFVLGWLGALALPVADAQVLATRLQITVVDELGNRVEGAQVTLYANEDDYRNSRNPVQEAQKTDGKGRVTFSSLEPEVYYVNVEKGDKNNFDMATQTEKLTPRRTNQVTIVIS